MLTLEFGRDLFAHMEWADAKVWAVTTGTPAAVTDRRIHDLLFHLHLTQHAFLLVWTGQPVRHLRDLTFPSLAELHAWARPWYAEAAGFLSVLGPARLSDPSPVPWAKMFADRLGRDPAISTLGETIAQVTLHSLYHRGQVNARLKELGAEPPLVDYLAWIWAGRPAPEWKMETGDT